MTLLVSLSHQWCRWFTDAPRQSLTRGRWVKVLRADRSVDVSHHAMLTTIRDADAAQPQDVGYLGVLVLRLLERSRREVGSTVDLDLEELRVQHEPGPIPLIDGLGAVLDVGDPLVVRDRLPVEPDVLEWDVSLLVGWVPVALRQRCLVE